MNEIKAMLAGINTKIDILLENAGRSGYVYTGRDGSAPAPISVNTNTGSSGYAVVNQASAPPPADLQAWKERLAVTSLIFQLPPDAKVSVNFRDAPGEEGNRRDVIMPGDYIDVVQIIEGYDGIWFGVRRAFDRTVNQFGDNAYTRCGWYLHGGEIGFVFAEHFVEVPHKPRPDSPATAPGL